MDGDIPGMRDDELRRAFSSFDFNRDGRIAASELEAVLNFLGVKSTPAEVRQMIKDADCDGNGTVEYDEFIRMMRRYFRRHRCKSPDDELLEAFNVFDHNRDSVIDFGEIKRTMHFLGEAVTDEEVQEMIREADQNNDGLVNFEEFKYMMNLVQSKQDRASNSS